MMLYQLTRNGQSYGPYSIEDIQKFVASGNILPTDLVKSDSMPDWVPVANLLGTQPPAPPAGFNQPAPWVSDSAATTPVVPQKTAAYYPFFPVSTTKFVVMSIFTLGFYLIYWGYQNWARINVESHEGLMPWVRAIFSGIFNFSLFGRVHSRAFIEDIPARWNYILLAILFIVLSLSSRLHGGVGLISIFSFAPYLPVVNTVAKINAKFAAITEEPVNDRFTAANIVWIVLGGIVLFFAIVGSIMQATGLAPAT